ncbi:uncharacterized protein LOC143024636 isoform X2 [Oratosquilla oratoria]|uniref:uncharacterized protein LOC143024636 isoform X2 n=1 Tax=Oratosquilla oratoria TaxID=337810 RepID=UPI003F75BD51
MSSWHTSGSDDSNPGRAYGSDPDEVSSSGITYFCDSSQFSCLRLSSTCNTPEYSGAVGGTYGIGSTSEDIGGFYDIVSTPEYSGTVGSYGIGSTPEYAGAIGGSHGVGSTLEYSGAVGSDGSCSEEEDDRGLYLDLDQERRSQLDPVGAAGVQETLSSGCNSSSSRINSFDPGFTKKGKPRKVMAWQKNDLTEDPELRAKTDPAKKQRIRREAQKNDGKRHMA